MAATAPIETQLLFFSPFLWGQGRHELWVFTKAPLDLKPSRILPPGSLAICCHSKTFPISPVLLPP